MLTLSTNPTPPVVQLGQHEVHRAKLDVQFASTGFSWSVFKQFRELARRSRRDQLSLPLAVHGPGAFTSAVNKPSVVTYHSDIIRQKHLLKLYRPLMNRFLASADRIVAASPNYLHTSDVLQQFQDKTRVIPYGLNKAGYPQPDTERMNRWRQQLGDKFFCSSG